MSDWKSIAKETAVETGKRMTCAAVGTLAYVTAPLPAYVVTAPFFFDSSARYGESAIETGKFLMKEGKEY